MFTRNIFETPIQQTNHLIYTSNGPLKVTQITKLPPNNYFPIESEFLIHHFSDQYDMVIGRKLLCKAKAIIDYKKGTVILFNNQFTLINIDPSTEQNYLQANPSFQQHPTILESSTFNKNLFQLDHLNTEEKQKITKLLNKFQDIQYHEGDKLTFINQERHTINTTHNMTIHSNPYSYPKIYEKEVENQIQDMLNQGIIRESNSPYCSPIWVVPKKNDASGQKKFRIVIDYRKLNDITVHDQYPIQCNVLNCLNT